MSGKYNIKILKGATFYLDFFFEQETDTGTDVPVDLTGATVAMQIRQKHSSADVLLDLAAEGLITIAEPLNGKIVIEIPATRTQELDFAYAAVYDIELTFPDTSVVRMLEGSVDTSPEVTR